MNNLYQYNLSKLFDLTETSELYIKNDNILDISNPYFNYFKKKNNLEQIKNIICILNTSFHNYINLLNFKNNYEEEDFNEEKLNLISYLEKCLESLDFFINIYENKEKVLLIKLKMDFKKTIELIKKNKTFKTKLNHIKNVKENDNDNDNLYNFNNNNLKNYIIDIEKPKEKKENSNIFMSIYEYIISKFLEILNFINNF